MKALTPVLIFVTLVLVLLEIGTLRELSRADRRIASLETKVAAVPGPKPYPLGEVMALNQRWTDKLWHAGQAQNWPLAAFYVGELKEDTEDIVDAKVTDEGIDVSTLVKNQLLPEIDELGKAVDAKDAAQFSSKYDTLVATCNACHATAKHPFIHVAAPNGRPWAQDFSPAPASP